MQGKVRERVLLYRLQAHHDPEAFAELYNIYVARIYRFVFFKVKSQEDAEDLTAEVFLKAWHYVSEKHEMRNFNALLYRIARNVVVDYYRTMQETESLDAPLTNSGEIASGETASPRQIFGPVSNSNPAKELIDVEISEELMTAIGRLKDEYKEVLTMRFIDGLSIKEIAEVLDKSSVSVRVTQHRAITALQRIMKE